MLYLSISLPLVRYINEGGFRRPKRFGNPSLNQKEI
jgi:hypothetical protein